MGNVVSVPADNLSFVLSVAYYTAWRYTNYAREEAEYPSDLRGKNVYKDEAEIHYR
jgi:hypothetical protein